MSYSIKKSKAFGENVNLHCKQMKTIHNSQIHDSKTNSQLGHILIQHVTLLVINECSKEGKTK